MSGLGRGRRKSAMATRRSPTPLHAPHLALARGRAAGLHHERASFLLFEERDQFAPSRFPPNLWLARIVYGVNLKHGLGGI